MCEVKSPFHNILAIRIPRLVRYFPPMVQEMGEIAQKDSEDVEKMTNPEMNLDEFVAAMDEIERLSDAGIYKESIAKLEKLFVDNEQYFENDERFLDYCILKGHSLYIMDMF